MEFTRARFYGNRPLTKARSDPVSFAAHLRAYARRGMEVEFVGPNWRVAGELPRAELHAYFRLPAEVRLRHIGPHVSENIDPRLTRLGLALPALLAGNTPAGTLHYHRDPLMALAARRYAGVHVLAVVVEPRTAVDRRAIHKADALVANTPALARWYEERYPGLAGRVLGRRGSFDPELAPWGRMDASAARVAHGVAPDARVVAYSGKVVAGSGELGMIAEACSGLGVTLLVAGGTDAARAWLQSICPPDLELNARGLVPPAELASLYAAADVLVSYYPSTVPTLNWVDPGKIYPYLGSGRPTVAAAHDSMSDLLVHGENAELAAPDDPTALRASLARVLDDPAYGGRLAANAQATVASYTIDAKVDAIIEFAEGLA